MYYVLHVKRNHRSVAHTYRLCKISKSNLRTNMTMFVYKPFKIVHTKESDKFVKKSVKTFKFYSHRTIGRTKNKIVNIFWEEILLNYLKRNGVQVVMHFWFFSRVLDTRLTMLLHLFSTLLLKTAGVIIYVGGGSFVKRYRK